MKSQVLIQIFIILFQCRAAVQLKSVAREREISFESEFPDTPLQAMRPANTATELRHSHRASNLYSLLDDLRDCLIHFIEYQEGVIGYERVAQPYLKTSTSDRQRRAKWRPIFKTRWIWCFMSIYITKGTEFDEYSVEKKHPFEYIMESFDVYQKFVLFIGSTTRAKKGKLTFIQSLNPQTFLTPIFYFQYAITEGTEGNSDLKTVTLTQGWFICKYCSPNRFVSRHFNCPQDQSCFNEMIQAYVTQIDHGRNVLWNVYNDPWSLDPDMYDVVVNRPFDIKTVDEAKRVTMAFLLQGQNRTLIKEATEEGSLISARLYETPKVIRKIDRIYARGSLHLLNNGRGYLFITSDGVYDVYDLKSFYIAPFVPHVWYIIWGIMTGLTIFISIIYIRFEGFSGFRILWVTFLWLIGSMLEQSGMRYSPEVTRSRFVWRLTKATFAVWILGTVPLLGFYKGCINAGYSVYVPYETKWKFLRNLTNFTLYSATWDCSFFPNDTYKLDGTTDPNLTTLCRELPLEGYDTINCKFWTDVTERIFSIRNHSCPTPLSQRQLVYLENIESKLVYTCQNHMEKLIRNELQNPQTAFVTSRDDLPIFWEYFQREMQRNASAKFAHNLNSGDSMLTVWHINYLSTVDEYHRWVVHKRMEVLMSSGIRWFWDKWSLYNRQRPTFRPQAIREAQRANQIALTFSGSDIPVIFYTHVSISVLCVVVFVAEITCCRPRNRTKPFPFPFLR